MSLLCFVSCCVVLYLLSIITRVYALSPKPEDQGALMMATYAALGPEFEPGQT